MKRITVMLALLTLAACVHRTSPSPEPATTLRVRNDAFADMNIYLLRGMEEMRLGTATGNRTTVLKIPSAVLFGSTPLRFQARPIGGSRLPITEEINVTAGDEVTMIIPPN